MTDLELIGAFCTHIQAVEDGWRTHAPSGTIPPNVQATLDLYRAVAKRFDQLAHYPPNDARIHLGQDWVSRVTNEPEP